MSPKPMQLRLSILSKAGRTVAQIIWDALLDKQETQIKT